MKKIYLAILFAVNFSATAQLRNSNWCFGDSSGINFSIPTSPTTFPTGFRTRGSCVSISDSSGQLLFYANTRATVPGRSGQIWNTNNLMMQNGDSIIGGGWYQEMTCIPNPSPDDTYYIFSIGVTNSSQFGLYYSIIDMNQNSGLGAVVQKNIQLQSIKAVDGINAVKHANGRDWWLIFRNWVFPYNNDYYVYLITPASISLNSVQSIGDTNKSGGSYMQFNKNGDRILIGNWMGLLELLDFDRCTGVIALNKVIEHEATTFPYYLGCEFSPNGRFAYLVSADYGNGLSDSSHLYQYDLNLSNPATSRIVLHGFERPEAPGYLRLAPDNKIYLSSAYEDGSIGFPYADNVRNYVNENLSVINSPDSLGATCNFTPFSFYLGGTRTYYGLPNNPDYGLGPVTGSVCDTLTWIGIVEQAKQDNIVTFPNPFYNKVSFHPINSSSEKISITVFNNVGEKVFAKETLMENQEIDLNKLTKGIYFLNVRNEKFSVTRKIVKL
jgi:hypothetical protein